MVWLSYTFYAFMAVIGAVGLWAQAKAGSSRKWIYLAISLLGAGGLVGVFLGRTEREWRLLGMGATFLLLALDYVAQYRESQQKGQPKSLHLWLALAWGIMGAWQLLDAVDIAK